MRGILGIEHVPDGVRVAPCLSPAWDAAEVRLGSDAGSIAVRLERVDERAGEAIAASADAAARRARFIAFPPAGQVRRVTLRVGALGRRRS